MAPRGSFDQAPAIAAPGRPNPNIQSSVTPNKSGSAIRPFGVMATARVPSMRRTQPRAKQCAHNAAPTHPAKCGRRSLQSSRDDRGYVGSACQAAAPVRRRGDPKVHSLFSHGAGVRLDFRVAPGDEEIGYGDAQTARQVVVAGASRPQGVFARAGTDRLARRRGGQRYSHHAFHHCATSTDARRQYLLPTLLFYAETAGLDHSGQMLARGHRRDPCDRSEFRSGQRPTIHQSVQHRSAARIARERRDFGEHRWACHGCPFSDRGPRLRATPRNNCGISTDQANTCHPRKSGDLVVGHDETPT